MTRTLGAALLAGVALVLLAGYIAHNERLAAAQHKATDTESLIARAVTTADHTLGDPAAPIQVIAYSSISCPYCRTFFEKQVPRLQAAFGDKIVIAYRHNPVPVLPNAQIQEAASECVYQADGNEAFWRFVRALFPQAARAEARDVTFLESVAVESGVDRAVFASCMQKSAGTGRVVQDAQEAAVGGLTLDPSFLLKSPNRALVIKGDFYSQIYAGIQYLLANEQQSKGAS